MVGMLDITNSIKESLLSISVSRTIPPDTYDKLSGQHFYYRQIDSRDEKEAVACLVKDDHLRDVYLFTWVGFTHKGMEVRI